MGGHDFSRAIKDEKTEGLQPQRYLRSPGSARFSLELGGHDFSRAIKDEKTEGLQPQRYLQVPMSHETWGSTSPIPLH
jgi:hypothetical protein